MSAARWLATAAGALLVLVGGSMVSEEVRARLDRLPFAVLRLARARLPAGLRERVHDQEWVPELEHILKHAELLPLTRLLIGIRYAVGLLMRAGTVAAELQPPGLSPSPGCGEPRWRRLGARSAGILHALFWPAQEPIRVRVYVAGMAAVAAATTGVAASGTAVHGRDLELFAILIMCSLAARGPVLASGDIRLDLLEVWFLPAAVLLPPVYALITPTAVIAVRQRHPFRHQYRRVFSAGANGLAYGAASELAHAVARPATGHLIPPGITPFGWALVIATCELLAVAGMSVFLLVAIKTTSPSTRFRSLLTSRTTIQSHLTALALGTAATFTAAAYPLLVIVVIPAAFLASRYLATPSTTS